MVCSRPSEASSMVRKRRSTRPRSSNPVSRLACSAADAVSLYADRAVDSADDAASETADLALKDGLLAAERGVEHGAQKAQYETKKL
jgi:hypothetical protein